MKSLLSESKINDIRQQLKNLEKSLQRQHEEQTAKGGASDSWHESAAYGATQAATEAKISELRNILTTVEILPEKVKSKEVILGSWVELKDENENIQKYRLVHPLEADPKKRLLSVESPLGKRLLSRKVNEIVEFNELSYEVIKVE